MGTWGPGLFSDDTARDVRATYRELIEDGVSDADAMKSVLAAYATPLEDPDEGSVVWLALASTQHALGRLDPAVRDRALKATDAGEGLARWAEGDPKMLAKRKTALAKARVRLLSEQPKRRRLRKPKQEVTKLHPGDVVSYRAVNGRLALLRVTQLLENRLIIAPVLRALDFKGRKLPPLKKISRVNDRPTPSLSRRLLLVDPGPWRYVTFVPMIGGGVDYEEAGLTLVGNIGTRPDDVKARDMPEGSVGLGWSQLAESLERNLSTD